MRFALFAPFFVIFIQSRSTELSEYCISDIQCQPGEQCIPDVTGLLFCQKVSEHMTSTPKNLQPKQIICQNDARCRTFSKCMNLGWPGSCQYGSPEPKTCCSAAGLINNQCYDDADCARYLHCDDRNGIKTCQVIAGMLPYKTCQSNADCDILQICLFSKRHSTNLCLALPKYQVVRTNPFWGNNFGSDIISSSMIGNDATVEDFERQCTADYQCSIFEICAERSIPGNRICIHNPKSSNRQCRFNADCQSGQRCEKVLQSLYLCKAAKQVTFMQPCNYDYECAGNQHCVNINKNVILHQNFRYCLDRTRSCQDDVDCPSQAYAGFWRT